MNEVTIEAWEADRLEAVRRFKEFWKTKKGDKDFPNALPMGEWDEQFEFFQTLGDMM